MQGTSASDRVFNFEANGVSLGERGEVRRVAASFRRPCFSSLTDLNSTATCVYLTYLTGLCRGTECRSMSDSVKLSM